jgi:RNA polymerase sigma-70 factor (ECF subfamily)
MSIPMRGYARVDFRPADETTDLPQRIATGDAAALRLAYSLHHTQVRALARRLLGDADEAEELVQDVFSQLPASARRFRGEASFSTFVLSIAVRRASRRIRTAVRRRKLEARLHRENASVPGGHASPESGLARQQLRSALIRALDRLPTKQRIAFVLREVEERSADDVARIVGVPAATVRTRVFHAKRKLREYLSEEGFQ